MFLVIDNQSWGIYVCEVLHSYRKFLHNSQVSGFPDLLFQSEVLILSGAPSRQED
jgi:hypothetical protein